MALGRGIFSEWSEHVDSALTMGIGALTLETSMASCIPCSVRTQQEDSSPGTRLSRHQVLKLLVPWPCTFQPSELCKIITIADTHPLYYILLQHAKQIKICLQHILFIHSSTGGHLSHFNILAIINILQVEYEYRSMFSVSCSNYLGVYIQKWNWWIIW